MSECHRLESDFEAYVAGDLDDSVASELLAHAAGCEDCRTLLRVHRDLTRLGTSVPVPDEARFDVLAKSVAGEARDALASGKRRSDENERAFGRGSQQAVWRTIAALAAGALLFAVGLFAGRTLPTPARNNGATTVTSRLVSAMGAEAVSNQDLADVEDSRFTYSNVSFREVENGRVALDFDVTTHVELVEPADSTLAREVLVHALMDPSNTGARLRALAYAGGPLEPKVKEALLFALARDASLAVRQKALALLAAHASQPDVEAAILATLRDDASVQMRLLALDALAAHRVDPNRIRDVIRERRKPGDEALMVRLAEHALAL